MSLSQCHILTIRDPNACFYHTFDAALAYRFTNADDPLIGGKDDSARKQANSRTTIRNYHDRRYDQAW